MKKEFTKGDKVFIRDFPLGNPTNVRGKIVGVLPKDLYNVLLETGWNEGKIRPFKFWKLIKVSEI
tara:strand:+ start:1066 stop:1260 length:195 start_codon:yes stop_codon:yes gene_type:complete